MTQPDAAATDQAWRQLWMPALACLLLLAAQGFLLFRNLQPSGGRDLARERVPLGSLTRVESEVRHRFGGEIIWNAAEAGRVVYRQDAVATMADAGATVEFLDRSEIAIAPESLVVFEEAPTPEKPSSRIVARLVRGSIRRVKPSATPVFLKFSQAPDAPAHQFSDSTGSSVFRVEYRAHGIEVTVESGALQVDGEPVAAGATRALPVPPGPEPEPLPPPQLKKPRIEIRTRDTGGGDPAEDGSASLPAGLGGPALALLRILGVGTAAAAEGRAGATKPPRKTEVSIRFEWEPLDGAARYQIQVARDPDFKDLVAEERVKSARFVYHTEAPATPSKLYFRVAGVDGGDHVGKFSAVSEVEIKPEPAPAVAQAEPAAPPVSAAPPAAPEPAPRPAVRAEPEKSERVARAGPKTAPKAEPKPQPEPEPAASPAPGGDSRLTEALPREPYRLRGQLAYGGVFHSRTFKSETGIREASGSALVPAQIRGELALARGTTLLRAGGSWLFESAAPSSSRFATDKAVVPMYRAWGLWGFGLGPLLAGIGPYSASSSTLTLAGTRLNSKLKPLFGALLDLLPESGGARLIQWRLQAAALALGSVGADANLTLRLPISFSPVEWGRWTGFFAAAGAQARACGVESAFGASLEVGYEF